MNSHLLTVAGACACVMVMIANMIKVNNTKTIDFWVWALLAAFWLFIAIKWAVIG